MRGIDKMYDIFGVVYEGEAICKKCRHHDDKKCRIYGEANNFMSYYPACGCYNKPYTGQLVEDVKHRHQYNILSSSAKIVHIAR